MSSEDEEIIHLDGRSISAGGAFRIKYSSTNKATETGSSWRTVLAERPGTVAETQFGKASDTSPGWWMHHNGALKFFVDRRLINQHPHACAQHPARDPPCSRGRIWML